MSTFKLVNVPQINRSMAITTLIFSMFILGGTIANIVYFAKLKQTYDPNTDPVTLSQLTSVIAINAIILVLLVAVIIFAGVTIGVNKYLAMVWTSVYDTVAKKIVDIRTRRLAAPVQQPAVIASQNIPSPSFTTVTAGDRSIVATEIEASGIPRVPRSPPGSPVRVVNVPNEGPGGVPQRAAAIADAPSQEFFDAFTEQPRSPPKRPEHVDEKPRSPIRSRFSDRQSSPLQEPLGREGSYLFNEKGKNFRLKRCGASLGACNAALETERIYQNGQKDWRTADVSELNL